MIIWVPVILKNAYFWKVYENAFEFGKYHWKYVFLKVNKSCHGTQKKRNKKKQLVTIQIHPTFFAGYDNRVNWDYKY